MNRAVKKQIKVLAATIAKELQDDSKKLGDISARSLFEAIMDDDGFNEVTKQLAEDIDAALPRTRSQR